jgi:hypothetical protein
MLVTKRQDSSWGPDEDELVKDEDDDLGGWAWAGDDMVAEGCLIDCCCGRSGRGGVGGEHEERRRQTQVLSSLLKLRELMGTVEVRTFLVMGGTVDRHAVIYDTLTCTQRDNTTTPRQVIDMMRLPSVLVRYEVELIAWYGSTCHPWCVCMLV